MAAGGRVPIKGARVPQGELRWRLVKDGFDTAEGASATAGAHDSSPIGETPAGMVYVAGGLFRRGDDGEAVAGLLDGQVRSDESANSSDSSMPAATASGNTGRSRSTRRSACATGQAGPGPATWEMGTFPEGQGDYPVSGVSWYEAAAYAEFVGKRLPTVFHWRRRSVTSYTARRLRRWRISTANRL